MEMIKWTLYVQNEVSHRFKEDTNIPSAINWRKATWMITSWLGRAFYNSLLKES